MYEAQAGACKRNLCTTHPYVLVVPLQWVRFGGPVVVRHCAGAVQAGAASCKRCCAVQLRCGSALVAA